jgi:NADH-quinone oxidoreductase subunit G
MHGGRLIDAMVNIEIDGIPLKVDSTKMIIQAADEAGIDIPRFCYHKKLSIAANCRMCLVEVDKARKALPACATPVTEGIKVFTQSKVAVEAQRGVMEFLLINHPLDCPICDQGGECELQDLSMGYGSGVSRFTEGKRVVKDKNIGPLINTDMTRCIHCTRCVRFGQEIAGIKELGATGRGEHMEIGTYIEHSLASELSGNIIDLCPVGALTSKPFRYQARAWELTAHPSIARHDAIGSNIELHTRREQVMRVVPRENESINEAWLSDRDRYSYLAIDHEQRATVPMIKRNGEWQQTDWPTALEFTVDVLNKIKAKYGSEHIGGLMSPTATLEEGYLFQKLIRGLGSNHIDHRLRQQDFADECDDYALKDWQLDQLESCDEVILLGCNIRAEAPILAHRIRQAAMNFGTRVSDINVFASDLMMPTDKQVIVDFNNMAMLLAGIAKALGALGKAPSDEWDALLTDVTPTAQDQNFAMQLANAMQSTLIVGALVNNHPQASILRSLAKRIAQLTNTTLIILPVANSNGLSQVGVLPDNSPLSEVETAGFNAQQMWQQYLKAYLLFDIEPELDCAQASQVTNALHESNLVVAMNSYVNDYLLQYADVILPIAGFAETSGTFVGLDKHWQSFTGAVPPKAESRPGWKVLRVLNNMCHVPGIDYVSSLDIKNDIAEQLQRATKANAQSYIPESIQLDDLGLTVISEVPMYQTDATLRRSAALQQTTENQRACAIRLCRVDAEKLKLNEQIEIALSDGVSLPLVIDDAIAEGCIYIPTGIVETVALGEDFGQFRLSEAS